MAFYPLLCSTRSPLAFSRFEYGGDDLFGQAEGKFGEDDVQIKKVYDVREEFVEYTKKKSHSLEELSKLYDDYDVQRNKVLARLTSNPLENTFREYKEKRGELVDILGGEEKVKTVPVIVVDRNMLSGYVELWDAPHTISQFEDFAGRKGIVFEVENKKGEEHVVTIHQRMRETACMKGGLWVLNSTCSSLSSANTEIAFTFLRSVLNGTHNEYKLVEK